MAKGQMRGATMSHSKAYGEEEQRSQLPFCHSTLRRNELLFALRYGELELAFGQSFALRASTKQQFITFNLQLGKR